MFECSCLLLQHHMHHRDNLMANLPLRDCCCTYWNPQEGNSAERNWVSVALFRPSFSIWQLLLLYLKLHWNEFDAQVFSGCAKRLATTSHCSCKQMTLSHSKAAGSLKFYLHVRFKQLYSTFIAIVNKMKKVNSTQWKNKHLSDWDPQLLIIYRHFLILSFLFV